MVILLASSPWWGRSLLSSMAFFRVRRIEVDGVRYLSPSEVVARLAVDTTQSVWQDLGQLERRLARHPQVRDVEVRRKLPGTLVVRVIEDLPVALVPAAGGLKPYDGQGRALPIDPSHVPLDLPVLAARDTGLLRILDEVRGEEPALFARISEARRVNRGELLFRLTSVPVRASSDVTAERLAEVVPVEGDLARRNARVSELDLRYRDQVIARLQ